MQLRGYHGGVDGGLEQGQADLNADERWVSRGWRLWRLLLLEADPGGGGVLFTLAEEG